MTRVEQLKRQRGGNKHHKAVWLTCCWAAVLLLGVVMFAAGGVAVGSSLELTALLVIILQMYKQPWSCLE